MTEQINEQLNEELKEELNGELNEELSEQPQTVPDFAEVDRWLEENYGQMEQDLLQLLAYPSVRGEAEPDAPFGQAVAQALECSLRLAEGLGFKVENVDGYMGIADMPGRTTEQVGVLTHLDVVPANPADWQYAPFAPVVENGRIYGRGTEDDKGPLVAALYGGLALARCGASLNKTVRFLFGCNEESGFNCIRYYLNKYEAPACGFSPDGYFPLVIGEKGLAHFSLCESWREDQGQEQLKLVSITSGTVVNVVPDRAEAVLAVEKGFAFDGADLAGLTITWEGKNVRISTSGKAAHASTPGEGENALAKLLQVLSGLNFYPRGAKEYVVKLAKLFADPCYGQSLGVADQDAHSQLTVIPSILQVDENQGTLNCDMRFPLTRKESFFHEKMEAVCRQNGLNLVDWDGINPLFAGEGSELAEKLLAVYREFTGDQSEPIIMGGGTYAKSVPNFLAFGPAFPGAPPVAHQADEYIEQKEWLDTAKIYARAIYQLAK